MLSMVLIVGMLYNLMRKLAMNVEVADIFIMTAVKIFVTAFNHKIMFPANFVMTNQQPTEKQ